MGLAAPRQLRLRDIGGALRPGIYFGCHGCLFQEATAHCWTIDGRDTSLAAEQRHHTPWTVRCRSKQSRPSPAASLIFTAATCVDPVNHDGSVSDVALPFVSSTLLAAPRPGDRAPAVAWGSPDLHDRLPREDRRPLQGVETEGVDADRSVMARHDEPEVAVEGSDVPGGDGGEVALAVSVEVDRFQLAGSQVDSDSALVRTGERANRDAVGGGGPREAQRGPVSGGGGD